LKIFIIYFSLNVIRFMKPCRMRWKEQAVHMGGIRNKNTEYYSENLMVGGRFGDLHQDWG
jgi:hypothetical protein